MAINDTVGGFCAHGFTERQDKTAGPLAGLTFGVKDLFDVAEIPTGAGNPDWLRTHDVPTADAPVVRQWLEAGARYVGKTMTDELAWSLNGQNAHYGTPVNVSAPGRIPGGSSSGSAAVTAAGLVDFALGSDTGGSVRAPASYCGIYGIRTTHDRISLAGAMPLAPSYDTIGWFARDPSIFSRVGKVLLDGDTPPEPNGLLLAADLFELLGPGPRKALEPAIAHVEKHLGPAEPVVVAGSAITNWRNAFRVIQGAEIWATHRDWLTTVKPTFGPGVRERFAGAPYVDAEQYETAKLLRLAIRDRMDKLFLGGAFLLLPSAPDIAPLTTTPESQLEDFRAAALAILCPAGHAGLPQVSLPLAISEGCPIGLSIMGPRGSDLALLDLAVRLGRP